MNKTWRWLPAVFVIGTGVVLMLTLVLQGKLSGVEIALFAGLLNIIGGFNMLYGINAEELRARVDALEKNKSEMQK